MGQKFLQSVSLSVVILMVGILQPSTCLVAEPSCEYGSCNSPRCDSQKGGCWNKKSCFFCTAPACICN